MENKRDEFHLANLSEKEIEQLKNLEKTFSTEKGEEIILIAYKNEAEKHRV